MFHIHPVTDNETVKTHFLPDDVLHEPGVGMARDSFDFVVGHHESLYPGVNTGLERGKEDFTQSSFG